MKFQLISLLLIARGLVNASPVPEIEWVTVTHYTTVSYGYDQYTHDFPQTSSATTSVIAAASNTFSTAETSEPAIAQSSTTPTPTSTSTSTSFPEAASTTTTFSAAATSSTASSLAEEHYGEGTYYDTGLGACGIVNVDTDYIVALSHSLFDQYTPNGNPNRNTLCGKKINAHYQGKTVQVTVTDRCEACAYNDLDFSPSAFKLIADQSLGRIKISWEWA